MLTRLVLAAVPCLCLCWTAVAASCQAGGQTPPAEDVWTTWHDTCPVVSPDGEQVLFLSTRANPDTPDRSSSAGRHGLCVVPLTGDVEPRVLATGSVGTPSWSPDGTKAAYCRKAGPDSPWGLEVLEIESGQVRVMPAPERTVFAAPVWLPDGRIAALARSIHRAPLFGDGFPFDPVIIDPAADPVDLVRLAAPESSPEEARNPVVGSAGRVLRSMLVDGGGRLLAVYEYYAARAMGVRGPKSEAPHEIWLYDRLETDAAPTRVVDLLRSPDVYPMGPQSVWVGPPLRGERRPEVINLADGSRQPAELPAQGKPESTIGQLYMALGQVEGLRPALDGSRWVFSAYCQRATGGVPGSWLICTVDADGSGLRALTVPTEPEQEDPAAP